MPDYLSRTTEKEQILWKHSSSSCTIILKENLSLIFCGEFTDNGFTGTNYNRPGFQEVIELVQAGKIECIIVKDLSRLGRNYIETGNFIEKICPMLNLRLIAINDGL